MLLDQENDELNKILGEKSKRTEVIELEESEEEEADEEDDVTNANIIAQLKTLGIDRDVTTHARIAKVQKKAKAQAKVNKLAIHFGYC